MLISNKAELINKIAKNVLFVFIVLFFNYRAKVNNYFILTQIKIKLLPL
jgi:hypothetical protein